MCGLPDIHWHDLKHIYASTLKNNAINMKAISSFLGHASPEFTNEVYVHQKEIAYDCSMLQEEWLKFCPSRKKRKKDRIFILPFTNEDYKKIISNLPDNPKKDDT